MWRAICLWLVGITAASLAFAGHTDDALVLLERAHFAARQLDYRGEFVLQRGPEVAHTRIFHQGSGAQEWERLQSLGAGSRETVRRGDETRTYLPRSRKVMVERSNAGARFPALVPLSGAQIERDYTIRSFAGGQVTGRDAIAVALDTRDAFHYSYRFWFDRVSGLLVRRQTVNEGGAVVEQVSFRQLEIGPLPQPQLIPSVADTRRWQVAHAQMRAADLSHWRLGWVPSGFMRVAMVSRQMASASGKVRDVDHLLYSNGLSSLSLFIEPWSAERSLSPLRLGALNMVGKRHGKFWLTIVGDVPMITVRQVADAIELAQISPK